MLKKTTPNCYFPSETSQKVQHSEDFITQYVAENSKMIETGIEQGLTRADMVRGLRDNARKTWAMLQEGCDDEHNDESPIEERDAIDPMAEVPLNELQTDVYYTGTPTGVKDMQHLDKVIFMIEQKRNNPYCLKVRFALYCERSGDYTLHVSDDEVQCARSYMSVKCVAVGKREAGISPELMPLSFRRSLPEEIDLAVDMIRSSKMDLTFVAGIDKYRMDFCYPGQTHQMN